MKRRYIRTLAALGAYIALSVLADAQSVYWTPSSGGLQKGKATQLSLNFESCSPNGNVSVPPPANANLQQLGQTSATNIVNGSISRKVIVNYRFTPQDIGVASIPSFDVETDKGTFTVTAVEYQVGAAMIGKSGIRPDDVFYSELKLKEDKAIYVGEVFELRYIFGYKQGQPVENLTPVSWSPLGVITPNFKEYQRVQFQAGADRYDGFIFDTIAMATESGEVKLPPATQTVSVVVGRTNRGFFFSNTETDEFNVATEPLVLDARPLPEGAPASFNGAVGQFVLESKVVPESVQVGEPVTWTLTLQGDGNWPQGIGLPAREVSTSFRAITPEVNSEMEEGSLFVGKRTEDIVLIPTEEGAFSFGPIEYSFFDPATESYKTITVPETEVVVTPVIAPIGPSELQNQEDPQALPLETGSENAPLLDVEIDPQGLNLLTKPIELPTGPVSEVGVGVVPKGKIALFPIVWAIAIPLIIWIVLALARAALFDPNKKRRKALADLERLAKLAPTADTEAFKKWQFEWREATRAYWEISKQEPTSKDVREFVSLKSNTQLADDWKALWETSDSYVYGREPSNTGEWHNRFKESLRRSPKPYLSLRRFFSAQAWYASIAFVCFFALSQLESDANPEALANYSAGAFEEATSLWKSDLDSSPSNWAVLQNLGLSSAQSDDWGNAFAYFVSSYALNPRDDTANWNLRLALNRSAAYDPILEGLVRKDLRYRAIALLSPGEWERFAERSIWVACGALSLLVITLYARRAGWLRRILLIIAFGSLFSVAIAHAAHRNYGTMANPDAYLSIVDTELKSVPTDLETTQQVTSLPQGSIGISKRSFLGWTQLELPNGEVGWTRDEALKPLYYETHRP